MNKRSCLFFVLSLLVFNTIYGQYNFTAVLSNLEGQDLLEALEQDFKPSSVLPYDIARDTMFRNVYGVNNSLSCVYTGHQVPMPLGQDPTQVVFMGGASGGINTEHSWPRSYGAESGNPKSDMHHLFPTRVDVNSDRGVLPYKEIPDSQTDSWYFMNIEQGNIPSSNIDLYSERSATGFEPPEKMKGNIARAIMYFKAIYPSQANQAPSNFFSGMQQTLCDWHYADPVDSLEWHRNNIIASYQSGKANPFILDCTLATRAYCPGTSIACDPTVSAIEPAEFPEFSIYPNPSSGQFSIKLEEPSIRNLEVVLYNSMGQLVFNQSAMNSEFVKNIDLSINFAAGLYWLQLIAEGESKVVPIILE